MYVEYFKTFNNVPLRERWSPVLTTKGIVTSLGLAIFSNFLMAVSSAQKYKPLQSQRNNVIIEAITPP